jgi:hypothetical protein
MNGQPSGRPSPGARERDIAPRTPPDGQTQDELLDEALKETFPASDPISVYRLD